CAPACRSTTTRPRRWSTSSASAASSAWSTASVRSTMCSPASWRRCGRCLRSADRPPPMKLHILGIAGTFMGGVAALARELGHVVEGSDQAVYPPMSTQLETLGIELRQGYSPDNISADCDEIVVGNALSRGNPAVEQVLDDGRRYISGAQWLSERVLPGRDTIAVAGTHGKTTTTTILTWLLQAAGREPGFLIGGVAEDFGVSARVGGGREFVVEADEYDTAFFDKRSKFVHYRPLVA